MGRAGSRPRQRRRGWPGFELAKPARGFGKSRRRLDIANDEQDHVVRNIEAPVEGQELGARDALQRAFVAGHFTLQRGAGEQLAHEALVQIVINVQPVGQVF